MAMWAIAIAIAIATATMVGGANGGRFNITEILAKYPAFRNFNRMLTETHVAGEINRHRTITVLAMDDDAMQPLLNGSLSMRDVADVLRYHVILDYYGQTELQTLTDGTTLATTLYQSTGRAAGNQGSLNITREKNGTVGIGVPAHRTNLTSTVVRSLVEFPFDVSILQVSNALLPVGIGAPVLPPVPAPAPAPAPTLAPVSVHLSPPFKKTSSHALHMVPARVFSVGSVIVSSAILCVLL